MARRSLVIHADTDAMPNPTEGEEWAHQDTPHTPLVHSEHIYKI